MRHLTDHDVLIVGAGPAGAQLAIRLARAGWSVALLDGRRFPRKKPCGEFMSPECLPILDELGLLPTLDALGAKRVQGMRLHGYGHEARAGYGPIGSATAEFEHGFAVRRELLDEAILRQAEAEEGVTLHEGWSVVALERGSDGAVEGLRARDEDGVLHSLRAHFTVGADGRQSLVARELGARRFVPGLRRFALVTRFEGVPDTGHGEVHFFPGGYFAAAPIDAGLFTLNLVVPEIPAGRAGLGEFLAACVERAPALAGRLSGARRVDDIDVCGPLATTTRAQVFDGAALVGDACGFVDPLTGEGLWYAMRGAQLLAPSLDHALRRGSTRASALRSYALARRLEFGPRKLFAHCLQRGIRRPELTRRVLALLERRRGLAELVVGLTGDYVSPRELLKPSVWWRALQAPVPVPAPGLVRR